MKGAVRHKCIGKYHMLRCAQHRLKHLMIINEVISVCHGGVQLIQNALGFVHDDQVIGLKPFANTMKRLHLNNQIRKVRQRPHMVHIRFKRRKKSDIREKDAELRVRV